MKFYFYFFVTLIFLTLFANTSTAESSTYAEGEVYKPTLKRWGKAVKLSTLNIDSWIWNQDVSDQFHKNKKRDAILAIPEASSPEDMTLVVWMHGLGGFSSKTFQNRIIPQIAYLADREESFAFLIPEMPWSLNTSTPRRRQGRVWDSDYPLDKFVSEAKQRLSEWAVLKKGIPLGTVRIVVVGHSAGGSAIMSASKEGGLCKLAPEHIIWSDASYGSWLSRGWNGCIKHLGEEVSLHVLVRKWDKPHKNAEAFFRRLKTTDGNPNILYQVLDRKRWSHGKIGNSVFELTDAFPPGC